MNLTNIFDCFKRYGCLALGLALAACASTPQFETPSGKKFLHPPAATVAAASKGQPVYLNYEYSSLIEYHLQESLEMPLLLGLSKVRVPSDVALYRGKLADKEVICSKVRTYFDGLTGPHSPSCFVDTGRTGRVNTVIPIVNGIAMIREVPIGRSIAYVGKEGVTRYNSSPTKKELIFDGYSDGQISLIYKEYENDLQKPALMQPVIVPVGAFPAKRSVKGLMIEFLSATDAKVSYKIMDGAGS